MALLKGEGHSIYILKTPSLEDLSQRSTNVVFLQNPGLGPCRAIPLEQLTKGAYGRKCSKGSRSSNLGSKKDSGLKNIMVFKILWIKKVRVRKNVV